MANLKNPAAALTQTPVRGWAVPAVTKMKEAVAIRRLNKQISFVLLI
jgi:hypothetical protein